MNLKTKSMALAAMLTLVAGTAMAAQAMDCCCKDKDGKMACCDEMKKSSADHSH